MQLTFTVEIEDANALQEELRAVQRGGESLQLVTGCDVFPVAVLTVGAAILRSGR